MLFLFNTMLFLFPHYFLFLCCLSDYQYFILQVFSIDDLYMLQRILPSDDELSAARRCREDTFRLSKAESFFKLCASSDFNLTWLCAKFMFLLEYVHHHDNWRARNPFTLFTYEIS